MISVMIEITRCLSRGHTRILCWLFDWVSIWSTVKDTELYET